MSIFNNTLIKELYKIAQDAEDPFVKRKISEDVEALGNKMISNLEQKLGGKTPQQASQDLMTKHLFSMGSFLAWLNEAKVEAAGKQIVIEKTQSEPEEAKEKEGYSFSENYKDYYVNKNGLLQYMQSLIKSSAESKDYFFMDMVRKLILTANNEFLIGIHPNKMENAFKQHSEPKPDGQKSEENKEDGRKPGRAPAINAQVPADEATQEKKEEIVDKVKQLFSVNTLPYDQTGTVLFSEIKQFSTNILNTIKNENFTDITRNYRNYSSMEQSAIIVITFSSYVEKIQNKRIDLNSILDIGKFVSQIKDGTEPMELKDVKSITRAMLKIIQETNSILISMKQDRVFVGILGTQMLDQQISKGRKYEVQLYYNVEVKLDTFQKTYHNL